MIPMTVSEENTCLNRHLLQQMMTDNSNPCPSIKDKSLTLATHFYTRGITAIAYCAWTRGGYTSTDTPKMNRKLAVRNGH